MLVFLILSCVPIILGCTDSTAINYNPNATIDDHIANKASDLLALLHHPKKKLSLPIERNSLSFNRKLVRALWDRAKDLGLSAFKGVVGPAIYDDHVPLYQYAGIPAIDIIDLRYPNSFVSYWHTMDDVPQNCSSQSLEQVGMLMVDYIYNRKFYGP